MMHPHFLVFYIAGMLAIPRISGYCHGVTTSDESDSLSFASTPYGYYGCEGPMYWYKLDKDYLRCATSKYQSPINLDSTISTTTAPVVVKIPDLKNSKFKNTGHTLELTPPPDIKDAITIFDSQTYKFLQFHFHTPGEHHREGTFHPMEMHLVHKNISP
jgi:carbonic anhydrase